MNDDAFFKGLLRRRDGIFSSDLLITAIGYLDFFNWLRKNPSDLHGICKGLKLAERPADVMLTFFSSLGLVKKVGTRYRLSENGRVFFTEGSKFDLRGYFNSLRERPICQDILSVLRTNNPLNWANSPKGDEWAKAMAKKDFAGSFTVAMDSRGAIIAPVLAEKLNCTNYTKLLDVAGASGIYSCGLVRKYSHLQAAVLEKSPVDTIAKNAIRKQGFSKKISVISADMFSDEWPRGFDIHLFSHVLHDWDVQNVQLLLQKSFDALEPKGLLAIHDAHINRQKTGPAEVAEYSILLMLSTRGKCYSVGEMEQVLQDVGFTNVRLKPTAGFRSVITARKPD
jgi:2-polyprenyl-3-methyl-5-hydroxy-6-metoxy-1,4-benzoquinol methylase